MRQGDRQDRGVGIGLVLVLVILMPVGRLPLSHAQMIGGLPSVPGTSFGGANDPSSIKVTDGFRLVPSITMGERYDSNVFFAPDDGSVDLDDLVTTTMPQIRGLYGGDLMSANVTAAAVGEYYIKNPGLSYVGTNIGASLDMSKFAERIRPKSTWQMTEFYTYTPQPPAFLTGDVEGASNPYVRGFQAFRTNVQINNLSTNLSVPLTQTWALRGSYSYGFMKFGESSVQQAGALLDSTSHYYTAGISDTITPVDTLSVNFVGSQFSYGSQGSFSGRGGNLGWSHIFSERASVASTAGVQFLETAFEGASNAQSIAPTATINGTFKDRITTVGISYVLGVTPAYQFQPQPLLTHTVSLAVTQLTPIPDLVGVLGLNYSKGSELGSSSTLGISYTGYGATLGLTYKVTSKTFLGLNMSYQNFDNTFGVTSYSVDRSVVQVTLSQAFY